MSKKRTVIYIVVGVAAIGSAFFAWQAYRGRFALSKSNSQESDLLKAARERYGIQDSPANPTPVPAPETVSQKPQPRADGGYPQSVSASQDRSFSDVQRTLRSVNEINQLNKLNQSLSNPPAPANSKDKK